MTIPSPALAPATTRHDQTHPVLSPADVGRVERFAQAVSYLPGEQISTAGARTPGVLVVLEGTVVMTQRDGLGRITPLHAHGPGQFMGEVAQLSGRAALVDGVAEGAVRGLLVRPEQLPALFAAEADIGERLVRAIILRRVKLLQANAAGPALIGYPGASGVARLQGFLDRNGYPYHVLDVTRDLDAAAMHSQFGATAREVLAVCPDGSVLLEPTESALARCMGMVDTDDRAEVMDVVIVGAGPAGLAASVYAASEGLRVLVLDCRAFGGQAASSARIENYLGFPTGISGHALAARAFVQAQKFGVQMMIPAAARGLRGAVAGEAGELVVKLDDGRVIRSRTVVAASGARYRRPEIPRLAEFEGNGVWYWASPLEARRCSGSKVVLVGGGNSAGQAAVYLSQFASHIFMLVRGAGLGGGMSQYLIDRMKGSPVIEILPHTELISLHGDEVEGLRGVSWRDRRTGDQRSESVRDLFLFVGAEPETDWLKGSGVALDARGFIITGPDASLGAHRAAALETSLPGFFAVGDVRSGSVKRVGGAIGEGAAAVSMIHQRLANLRLAAASRH